LQLGGLRVCSRKRGKLVALTDFANLDLIDFP